MRRSARRMISRTLRMVASADSTPEEPAVAGRTSASQWMLLRVAWPDDIRIDGDQQDGGEEDDQNHGEDRRTSCQTGDHHGRPDGDEHSSGEAMGLVPRKLARERPRSSDSKTEVTAGLSPVGAR